MIGYQTCPNGCPNANLRYIPNTQEVMCVKCSTRWMVGHPPSKREEDHAKEKEEATE